MANEFKNFTAAARKPNIASFGLLHPDDDPYPWIASNIVATGAPQVTFLDADITGTRNGSNDTFTISASQSYSHLDLFRNGSKLINQAGADGFTWSQNPSTFTITLTFGANTLPFDANTLLEAQAWI